MTYFVYLLECADKTIYTGITTDIVRRLNEHKKGTGARYTRTHGVRRIIYSEQYKTRSAALKREAAIKRLSRASKLSLALIPKL